MHEIVPLSLRLPGPLRDRLQRNAETNRRSMNSEIVYTLEQALPEEETKTAEGGQPASTSPTAV